MENSPFYTTFYHFIPLFLLIDFNSALVKGNFSFFVNTQNFYVFLSWTEKWGSILGKTKNSKLIQDIKLY